MRVINGMRVRIDVTRMRAITFITRINAIGAAIRRIVAILKIGNSTARSSRAPGVGSAKNRLTESENGSRRDFEIGDGSGR